MRVLMTSNRGAGHIGPMAPFAHALLEAGDDVLLAAPASSRPTAERAGVPFHVLADPPDDRIEAVMREFPGLSGEEQGVRMMQQVFAGIDTRSSLPGVLRAIREHRPHVVLREPTEFAGLLAAERHGLPHGRIAIMAGATESWGVPIVAGVLDGHRLRLGLRPDPRAVRIDGSPYLTVLPAAMEDPADPGPPHALRFREPVPPVRPLPDWWPGDDRPLVYATYGSVTPALPVFGALFRATVAALGELPVRAVFTVGTDVDPVALGPVPANVRVERWMPQAAVMPHAAAMVGHGGAGSTRMALAAGVPAVVVPGFADQHRNAERVAALGAGIALGDWPDGLAGLADALRLVLKEPNYRAAAARVAAEVAATPPVAEAPAALRAWLQDAQAA